MSLILFEGVAGTGKTTELIKAVQKHISAHPLIEGQRILALTKMHGSRKRMETKLSNSKGLTRFADCVTIDSFARNLVRRWKGLLKTQLSNLPADGDFEKISSAAGHLLTQIIVGNWVTQRYPVILVDEMQDCKGGAVDVLRGLVAFANLFSAADEFQDLSGTDLSGTSVNEAVEWARTIGTVKNLPFVHRTSDPGLLEAARALRYGHQLSLEKSSSFEIYSVPKAALGGAIVSWKIKSWPHSHSSQIAIISPTKRDTSAFVRKVLEWVSSKEAKTKKSQATAGPYKVNWENSEDEILDELFSSLGFSEDLNCEFDCYKLAEAAGRVKAKDVQNWFLKQLKLGGIETISHSEARSEIRRIVHQRRAFGFDFPRKLLALTVHQAKNREFDSVIVLWPMRMRDDPEQNRRLLYNAITRAKLRAIVIVEDPNKERLNLPLFGGM